MYNDGISNEFEKAHQTGLSRGFDLGWSYKGKFDRAVLMDLIDDIPSDTCDMVDKREFIMEIIEHLRKHKNNRENITMSTY